MCKIPKKELTLRAFSQLRQCLVDKFLLFNLYKEILICLVEKNGSVIKSQPIKERKDYGRIVTKRNSLT